MNQINETKAELKQILYTHSHYMFFLTFIDLRVAKKMTELCVP